jgi:hypothetical protein
MVTQDLERGARIEGHPEPSPRLFHPDPAEDHVPGVRGPEGPTRTRGQRGIVGVEPDRPGQGSGGGWLKESSGLARCRFGNLAWMHEQVPVQMPQPSSQAAIQERIQSMPSYSLRTTGDEHTR